LCDDQIAAHQRGHDLHNCAGHELAEEAKASFAQNCGLATLVLDLPAGTPSILLCRIGWGCAGVTIYRLQQV
jgi:hypothetical protein